MFLQPFAITQRNKVYDVLASASDPSKVKSCGSSCAQSQKEATTIQKPLFRGLAKREKTKDSVSEGTRQTEKTLRLTFSTQPPNFQLDFALVRLTFRDFSSGDRRISSRKTRKRGSKERKTQKREKRDALRSVCRLFFGVTPCRALGRGLSSA